MLRIIRATHSSDFKCTALHIDNFIFLKWDQPDSGHTTVATKSIATSSCQEPSKELSRALMRLRLSVENLLGIDIFIELFKISKYIDHAIPCRYLFSIHESSLRCSQDPTVLQFFHTHPQRFIDACERSRSPTAGIQLAK